MAREDEDEDFVCVLSIIKQLHAFYIRIRRGLSVCLSFGLLVSAGCEDEDGRLRVALVGVKSVTA